MFILVLFHCNCQVSSMWKIAKYFFNVPKIK